MKKNDFLQIKGLDVRELKVKARTLKEEIANLTLDKNMKKLKDLKMVSKKKKELAQILTIIKQKELLIQLESISHQTEKIIEKEEKLKERKEKNK
ncbi:MAG: 50S ribosomal protein L29 [Candidatus Daviesbacteria bacterium]|nr:50S ribosomal protein L29 [Candidatus Daviesbacteria bacterium]